MRVKGPRTKQVHGALRQAAERHFGMSHLSNAIVDRRFEYNELGSVFAADKKLIATRQAMFHHIFTGRYYFFNFRESGIS